MDINGEMYRRIVEAVPQGIWVVDPQGLTIFSNRRMSEILGVDFESMAEQSCFGCVFPDELEDAQRLFARALAGDDRPFDFRLRRADGSPIWVNISCMPMMDDAGGVTGLLGLFLDISERKQTESALRDSEERFRVMFLQAAVGIAQTSLDAKWLLLNDRFCELLGYTQAELQGKTYLDITHPDDRPRSLNAVNQLIAGEIPSWTTEKRYIRKDGAIVWGKLFISLVRDATGEPQYFIAAVEDITERIRAESALRESERRLALALNAAHLGVWDCDLDKKEVALSPTYREVYHRNPLSFEEWIELVHPDDRERVKTLARESLTGNHQWDAEFRILLPDGSIRWMHSKAVVLVDDAARPVRLVGVSQDVTEGKHAEAVLRESEERFRHLADTAPVMIWISGLDKRCIFFNKPWLDFSGRTIEQEMGDGWTSCVHPDDLARCLATYSSAFDARRNFQMEYRLRRADGEFRWVLDNGTPRYHEGEFAGYIGSCIDVTEQKQIEERLRSNQAQLIDSQRLAKVGSWELDVATGKVRWSDEMYRIYGLPNDARPDFQMFLSLVQPRDRGIIAETHKRAVSTNAPVGVEFRITRPDGEVRFIRSILEAMTNDEGVPVRFAGAAQDITEEVKATELLRESEARLKNAERMTHVGNWIWDIKTNRVLWSEEILRMMGQSQDYEPSYEEFVQLIAPQERDRVEQWVRDCLAERRGNRIEVRIVRPDGNVRTVVCTSEVLLDEDGSPARMFGTCQDVTDARRTQEEAFARQKLESLGTLASGIAHDFNNLLGAVLAQAELAMAERATGSDSDEELKEIRNVAVRGSEIVRQLMIYAGKESDVLESVDVSKAVEEMLGLLKVTLSKHAALVTDLGENLPLVKARVAQLRQIVMNLVVNASDAIKDHDGVIRVATGCVTVDRDTAGMASEDLAEGEYVELTVSDTGRGMSPEAQARVFDPFFTTKSAGRGLGLAVVHGIVRSLRGAIHVVSELGKGTTFQILLPSAGAAAGGGADPVQSTESAVRPSREGTVLVVEDERPLRLAVTKMLHKAGFEVFEAANGSDAVELLRTKAGEIDLILLDLTIPGAPSHEVLAEAVRVRPDMKVILTSAYSEDMANATLGAPQVAGFVRKPFQLANLVRTLRNALSSEATP